MSLVELRLPAHVEYVGLARRVVKAAARQAGLPDDRIEDLEIAVSEATTKALLPDHEPRAPTIVLRFGAHAGAFEVHVLQEGEARPFESNDGISATVIRGLADEVEYPVATGQPIGQAAGGGVTMRFALDGKDPAA